MKKRIFLTTISSVALAVTTATVISCGKPAGTKKNEDPNPTPKQDETVNYLEKFTNYKLLKNLPRNTQTILEKKIKKMATNNTFAFAEAVTSGLDIMPVSRMAENFIEVSQDNDAIGLSRIDEISGKTVDKNIYSMAGVSQGKGNVLLFNDSINKLFSKLQGRTKFNIVNMRNEDPDNFGKNYAWLKESTSLKDVDEEMKIIPLIDAKFEKVTDNLLKNANVGDETKILVDEDFYKTENEKWNNNFADPSDKANQWQNFVSHNGAFTSNSKSGRHISYQDIKDKYVDKIKVVTLNPKSEKYTNEIFNVDKNPIMFLDFWYVDHWTKTEASIFEKVKKYINDGGTISLGIQTPMDLFNDGDFAKAKKFLTKRFRHSKLASFLESKGMKVKINEDNKISKYTNINNNIHWQTGDGNTTHAKTKDLLAYPIKEMNELIANLAKVDSYLKENTLSDDKKKLVKSIIDKVSTNEEMVNKLIDDYTYDWTDKTKADELFGERTFEGLFASSLLRIQNLGANQQKDKYLPEVLKVNTAERVDKVIDMDLFYEESDVVLNYWRPRKLITTGIYLPAGENIKITITPKEGEEKYEDLINANFLKVQMGLSPSTKTPIVENVTRPNYVIATKEMGYGTHILSSRYGGPIYLEAITELRKLDLHVDVKFEKVVTYPVYKNGETTPAKWKSMLANSPVNYAEIVDKGIAVSGLATDAKKYEDDIQIVADEWARLLSELEDLAYGKTMRNVPRLEDSRDPAVWRYIMNPQINRAVSMSSGTVIETGYDNVFQYGNYNNRTDNKDKGWGFNHELGHNHQMPAFIPNVEISNNIYPLFSQWTHGVKYRTSELFDEVIKSVKKGLEEGDEIDALDLTKYSANDKLNSNVIWTHLVVMQLMSVMYGRMNNVNEWMFWREVNAKFLEFFKAAANGASLDFGTSKFELKIWGRRWTAKITDKDGNTKEFLLQSEHHYSQSADLMYVLTTMIWQKDAYEFFKNFGLDKLLNSPELLEEGKKAGFVNITAQDTKANSKYAFDVEYDKSYLGKQNSLFNN